MRFNGNVKFGDIIPASELPEQLEIRHIPQFYRADADYAYRLGGPAVRKFIDRLPLNKGFRYVSIDSRVHMLMPGWMPCIGGWHCDDFYRPTGAQPDLEGIGRDNKHSRHHVFVIGEAAPTEFLVTPFDIPVPEIKPGENLYKKFDDIIEGWFKDECAMPRPKSTFVKSGQTVSFDCFDFHRGTVAKSPGWRLFMRATESNHYEPQNEIRTQTQVYLENFHAGW